MHLTLVPQVSGRPPQIFLADGDVMITPFSNLRSNTLPRERNAPVKAKGEFFEHLGMNCYAPFFVVTLLRG
jgi:hypothetical protein